MPRDADFIDLTCEIIDLTSTPLCDTCDDPDCLGLCLPYSDDDQYCASWCANQDCDGDCRPGNCDANDDEHIPSCECSDYPRCWEEEEEERHRQYIPSSPSFCPATPEYNAPDEHYWGRQSSPAFYPHDPELDGPLKEPNVVVNGKPVCPPAPMKKSNPRPRRYVGRETQLLMQDRYRSYWQPTAPRRNRK